MIKIPSYITFRTTPGQFAAAVSYQASCNHCGWDVDSRNNPYWETRMLQHNCLPDGVSVAVSEDQPAPVTYQQLQDLGGQRYLVRAFHRDNGTTWYANCACGHIIDHHDADITHLAETHWNEAHKGLNARDVPFIGHGGVPEQGDR